jgi:hypothetical protein
MKGGDKYLDKEFDTLTNPTIVFEVLSKSTKQFDKSKKLSHQSHAAFVKHFFTINKTDECIESESIRI